MDRRRCQSDDGDSLFPRQDTDSPNKLQDSRKASMRPTSPYLWLGLLWLAALIGVGAFTFQYGEGLSYFSTDPDACANCHIMRPQPRANRAAIQVPVRLLPTLPRLHP